LLRIIDQNNYKMKASRGKVNVCNWFPICRGMGYDLIVSGEATLTRVLAQQEKKVELFSTIPPTSNTYVQMLNLIQG